jgi:uncharacterized peroxidase-related enzyme
MSRIKPLDLHEVSKEAKAVYEEIQTAFGMVPNLFKTYAYFPPLLKVNWEKTKVLLMGGSLSRELKECIAIVVSQANSCQYCVTAHSMMLKGLGFPDERVQAVQENLDAAALSQKERKILDFVKKSTLAPLTVTDQEFQELKELGLTDAEIVEMQGVMEHFTAYNKFIDSLSVTIDF